MDYELAKELKEVGFLQMDINENLNSPDKQRPYQPTLSELIEACGDDFEYLKKIGDEDHVAWVASGLDNGCQQGSTPEEAVARLWLALNKKA